MAKTLNAAAEDKKTIVAEVERAGEKILIPEEVSLSDAIETLIRKQNEEEQAVGFSHEFDAFVWEGAYALANALDARFGWFRGMTTPGSFFSPATPPALKSIKTGPDSIVKVPWGRFSLPGIPDGDGFLQTTYHQAQNGMVCFTLAAQLKRKHSKLWDALCEEINKQLKINSLYRGKGISIAFHDDDGDEIEFPEPTFPRISKLDPSMIVFNRDIEAQIKANLYTPIERTADVRAAGIPLKRGVLLAGPYGTGKTLVATQTANLAVENGWTFLFCQSAQDFTSCVRFAQQYQPAVVFCEDIDRITDGDRDEAMDEILNTIDGVDSKNSEIVLVLTTNEVENIHQGMLRPGRLDAVIAVTRPDAEAVQRLIRQYAGSRLTSDENLTRVGSILAGSTPSVIREVVERAKLTALAEGNSTILSEAALVTSAQTMRTQLDLLDRKPKRDPDPMETFGRVIAQALLDGAKKAQEAAPNIHEYLPSHSSNGRATLETQEV